MLAIAPRRSEDPKLYDYGDPDRLEQRLAELRKAHRLWSYWSHSDIGCVNPKRGIISAAKSLIRSQAVDYQNWAIRSCDVLAYDPAADGNGRRLSEVKLSDVYMRPLPLL